MHRHPHPHWLLLVLLQILGACAPGSAEDPDDDDVEAFEDALAAPFIAAIQGARDGQLMSPPLAKDGYLVIYGSGLRADDQLGPYPRVAVELADPDQPTFTAARVDPSFISETQVNVPLYLGPSLSGVGRPNASKRVDVRVLLQACDGPSSFSQTCTTVVKSNAVRVEFLPGPEVDSPFVDVTQGFKDGQYGPADSAERGGHLVFYGRNFVSERLLGQRLEAIFLVPGLEAQVVGPDYVGDQQVNVRLPPVGPGHQFFRVFLAQRHCPGGDRPAGHDACEIVDGTVLRLIDLEAP